MREEENYLIRRRTLHSCVLTNRQWCVVGIPYLWSDPFFTRLQPKQAKKLLDAYITNFSKEDKLKLQTTNIDDGNTLFDYITFMRSLVIGNVVEAVGDWLSVMEGGITNHQMKATIKEKSLFDILLSNILTYSLNLNHIILNSENKTTTNVFDLVSSNVNIMNLRELTGLGEYRAGLYLKASHVIRNLRVLRLSLNYFEYPLHSTTVDDITKFIQSQDQLLELSIENKLICDCCRNDSSFALDLSPIFNSLQRQQRQLSSYSLLTYLNLYDVNFFGEFPLIIFGELQNLKGLEIVRCYNFAKENEDVVVEQKEKSSSSPPLSSSSSQFCGQFFNSLESLTIHYSSIPIETLKYILKNSNKKLIKLKLIGIESLLLHKKSLLEFCGKHNKNLEYLLTFVNINVESTKISSFFESCKNLKHFEIVDSIGNELDYIRSVNHIFYSNRNTTTMTSISTIRTTSSSSLSSFSNTFASNVIDLSDCLAEIGSSIPINLQVFKLNIKCTFTLQSFKLFLENIKRSVDDEKEGSKNVKLKYLGFPLFRNFTMDYLMALMENIEYQLKWLDIYSSSIEDELDNEIISKLSKVIKNIDGNCINIRSTATVSASSTAQNSPSKLKKRTNTCPYNKRSLFKRTSEPPQQCSCALAQAVFTGTFTGLVVLSQNECGSTRFVGQFSSGFQAGHNYTFKVFDKCGNEVQDITQDLNVQINSNGGTAPFNAQVDDLNLNCDNHGILSSTSTSPSSRRKRTCTGNTKRIGEPTLVVEDDRLVLLLDTGSTPAIRSTAAQQLGEIQKQHPSELHNLLSRVIVHLSSKEWDTRLAAGQAIEAIAKNVPHWNPIESENDDNNNKSQPLNDNKYSFDNFDISNVIQNGKTLLGSAGKEYDLDLSDLDPAQRLAFQHKNLKERLGLGGEFMDVDIFDDIDISGEINNPSSSSSKTKQSTSQKIELNIHLQQQQQQAQPITLPDEMSGLKVVGRKNNNFSSSSPSKNKPSAIKVEDSIKSDSQFDFTPQPCSGKIVVESKKDPSMYNYDDQLNEWPFEKVCESLSLALFDPCWEVRHGAGIGLREILKVHGNGAGRIAGLTQQENEIRHNKWLDDVAIRLLCVFALDRFGDFVSDQVVAPVRETCSQTLGALIQYMTSQSVENVYKILMRMIYQRDFIGDKLSIWEVRHAGMLGLKYAVAVRRDLVEMMLEGAVDAVVLGLKDSDDDVRAVAASILVPIADYFVTNSSNKIPELVNVLWDCLKDLKDDLTASTASVMDLLVRSAVLNTLLTFLSMDEAEEWVDNRVMRLVFQNMIVEEKKDILDLSLEVWSKILSHTTKSSQENKIIQLTSQHIATWFGIVMTPFRGQNRSQNTNGNNSDSIGYNIDAGMLQQDFALVSVDTVLRGRVIASKGLGMLMNKIVSRLSSSCASNKQLSAIVVEEWARSLIENHGNNTLDLVNTSPFASNISTFMISILESDAPTFYSELTTILRRIRGECQALLNTFVTVGKVNSSNIPALPTCVLGEIVVASQPENSTPLFNIQMATEIATTTYDNLSLQILDRNHRSPQAQQQQEECQTQLQDRHRRVLNSISSYESTKLKNDTIVYAAIASAVVALQALPPKLNPIIRSIMNSIKKEENIELQQRSAATLANLVFLCSSNQSGTRINPNDKIVKNLCTFLCSDTTVTPEFQQNNNKREGILSLQKAKESDKNTTSSTSSSNGDFNLTDDDKIKSQKLIRRGAETALKEFASQFGSKLFEIVPKLWHCMHNSLNSVLNNDDDETIDAMISQNVGKDIIDSLQLIQSLVPAINESLHNKITELLPFIIKTAKCQYQVIRSMAARCFASIANVITMPCMKLIIDQVMPLLGDSKNLIHRQGAVELVYHVVQTMDAKILPYVIFLIVPILGRMSDADENIRLVSTNTFAMLIKLVPLEAGIPDPPGLSKEFLQYREHERKFLGQLLDSSKLDPYEIPVKIKAELRKYQQEGVNWLAFLNRYQLHGILCDDMGLGKTLQSICILASDHYARLQKHNATESLDCPSLVVCPPTLTGHWYHEIINYTDDLKPLTYTGNPKDRERLRPKIFCHDVVIMSYDILRNDLDELSQIDWNYCILDEGHVIKNGKTKITKAVKTIKANHRLILSGTPIQNNVLELWSLFDFLMPGFLGTEKQFNDRFGKPILSSRDSKSSSKEQEAGALALEALHKQVLPFLLRRLKEDVLNDLPPKIIQDYYCELSDLQKQLYEEFAKSQTKGPTDTNMEDANEEGGGVKKTTHIFQALQYLRKLCNHPLLVMNEKHPQYNKVMDRLKNTRSSLRDLENAPKLLALKQLLLDCGIGVNNDTEENTLGAGAVSQHRALIFCQLKTMLDIIENDLFKPLMPSVTFMRLDGSIDTNKRHAIVQQFNKDPSIDVLLLTTHVGGLGLNLTGADTVIFVEHDWNPMKDLQAMDRAHRIGQKKVVNVYRLITKGTLEEKIMGLQKFKLNIANSVVNQQNSGLQSMDTDQILDLFNVTLDNRKGGSSGGDGGSSSSDIVSKHKKLSTKNILEGLDNLWDDSQYEDLNLDNFIESLETKN
ncbi:15832_t:CDS:10 [Entrophospora sp. SA101]|nr:15832_t:CDS:10 [Entrophospora sp. SA101]